MTALAGPGTAGPRPPLQGVEIHNDPRTLPSDVR